MVRVRYDERGNAYRIASVKDGQCIVFNQIVDGDGEQYDGELRIIQESSLYDKAPRQKLDNQIVDLQETLKDLRQQILTRKKELQAFEDDSNDRIVRLKQHKSLQRLDDFIAGRITHYVEISYGPPTIVKFEDALMDASLSSGRHDKLKLLTLFGRTDGDLEWGLNRYNDGSGSNSTVFPCTSYSEAVEVAGKLFAEHAREALNPNERTSPGQAWVKRASEYGIGITPDYLQQLQKQEGAAKTKRIADLESQIKTLRESE